MKHLVTIIFFALILSVPAISQGLPGNDSPTKTDYLSKAKKQKRTAVILLAGGGGITVVSLVAAIVSTASRALDAQEPNIDIMAAGTIVGAASMLGSIPLFISAKKNRQKADDASISIYLKPEHNLARTMTTRQKAYPALSLAIKLK